VSEGLTLHELWAQFRREAGASARLYSKDLDAGPARRPGWRGWFQVAGALFWAMLRKLSPARRIFLLIGLILLVFGLVTARIDRMLFGALALVILLGLELADRVALKRDLEIARDIQRWLVPQTPPVEPGVDIAFTTRPANTVAGDYYDAFRCPAAAGTGAAHRLILVVADVAGKGMPAALLMATFQSSLRTLVQEPLSLVELVARLNRYGCEHSLEGRRFTTAVIAELDPLLGTLAYVNAGHNPPALRRATGAIEWLSTGGLPLGVDADAGYEAGGLSLESGDELLIYSDGVVEAQNVQGELYGEDRLTEWLGATRAATAADEQASLMAALDRFVGDAHREDDITCLVLRYTRR